MAQGGGGPKDKRLDKEAQLAAALRANLRRRKAGATPAAAPQPAGKTPEDKP